MANRESALRQNIITIVSQLLFLYSTQHTRILSAARLSIFHRILTALCPPVTDPGTESKPQWVGGEGGGGGLTFFTFKKDTSGPGQSTILDRNPPGQKKQVGCVYFSHITHSHTSLTLTQYSQNTHLHNTRAGRASSK